MIFDRKTNVLPRTRNVHVQNFLIRRKIDADLIVHFLVQLLYVNIRFDVSLVIGDGHSIVRHRLGLWFAHLARRLGERGVFVRAVATLVGRIGLGLSFWGENVRQFEEEMRGFVQSQTLIFHRWTRELNVFFLCDVANERVVLRDETGVVDRDDVSGERFGNERTGE